jgi:hypothetical protein
MPSHTDRQEKSSFETPFDRLLKPVNKNSMQIGRFLVKNNMLNHWSITFILMMAANKSH